MTRENTVNVPVEPTDAMLKAVYPLNENRVWKAMLSAAPLHEGEGEPVAWRVKDYADGWILFHHEAPARKSGEARNGALVQPLYAAPPPSVEVFGSSSLKGEDTHRDADGAVLDQDTVEWVVNDIAELGVKIGQQFFWLYKGHSLVYGKTGDDVKDGAVLHDDGSPMHWRPVFKREFGECAHPTNYADPRLIGTVSLDDSDEWKVLPPPPAASGSPGTSGASEPNPSVEVERLREALRDIDACSQHSFGFSDYSMRRRCGQIARAALSRKQEPGVPTPGDWIEWSGGENPVPGQTVEYRMPGTGVLTSPSDCIQWDHQDGPGDIIAYRIVPTPGGEA